MQVIVHEKSGKPETMTLTTDPMTVWLDREHELRIERGDTLGAVARVIEDVWGLDRAEARTLAAFWFAIGERAHTMQLYAPWSRVELQVTAARRYLPTKLRKRVAARR